MDGLFNTPRGVIPVLLTSFSTVRIHPDTQREIARECPNWLALRLDHRTKEYRRLREIERDISAISEVEWLHGDELTEF
jgi:hypothetical protein